MSPDGSSIISCDIPEMCTKNIVQPKCEEFYYKTKPPVGILCPAGEVPSADGTYCTSPTQPPPPIYDLPLDVA